MVQLDGCTHRVVGQNVDHDTVAGLVDRVVGQNVDHDTVAGLVDRVVGQNVDHDAVSGLVGLDYDIGLDVADCTHWDVDHHSTVVGLDDCATAVADNQAVFVEVVRYSWKDNGYPGCIVAGEPSYGHDN